MCNVQCTLCSASSTLASLPTSMLLEYSRNKDCSRTEAVCCLMLVHTAHTVSARKRKQTYSTLFLHATGTEELPEAIVHPLARQKVGRTFVFNTGYLTELLATEIRQIVSWIHVKLYCNNENDRRHVPRSFPLIRQYSSVESNRPSARSCDGLCDALVTAMSQ